MNWFAPRRLKATLMLGAALLVSAALAASANADFGLHETYLTFNKQDRSRQTQAGSHPYSVTTSLQLNSSLTGTFSPPFRVDGQLKDLVTEMPPGFLGNATVMPRCSSADFLASELVGGFPFPLCDDNTAVGVMAPQLLAPPGLGVLAPLPVYNLEPPPGVPVRLGFDVLGVRVTIDIGVKPGSVNNVVGTIADFPQAIPIFGGTLELWGVPADPSHDLSRGPCAITNLQDIAVTNGELEPTLVGSPTPCPSNAAVKPFLTSPGSCTGQLTAGLEFDSWDEPGVWLRETIATLDKATPPNPLGQTGCGKLDFNPTVESAPTPIRRRRGPAWTSTSTSTTKAWSIRPAWRKPRQRRPR